MEIKHSRNIRAIKLKRSTKLVENLSKNQKLQWCVQSSIKWFRSYFGLQFQRQRRRERSRVEAYAVKRNHRIHSRELA